MGRRRFLRDALCTWLPRAAVRVLELDREELGRVGEELAARALVADGWRVLGRRVRTPCGEVDLFVARGAERAVVEVKTARLPDGMAPSAQRFPPAVRVDDQRLARLRRAARFLGVANARVDVLEVVVHARGRRIELRHRPALERPMRPRSGRP